MSCPGDCSLWFERVESLSVFVYLWGRQIHLNLVLVAKTVSVVQTKHTTVSVITLPWHCSAVTAFGESNCRVFVVIRTRPCFINMFFLPHPLNALPSSYLELRICLGLCIAVRGSRNQQRHRHNDHILPTFSVPILLNATCNAE